MFKKAIPVFAEGKEREQNYQLILRGEAESLKGTTLYVAAASFYRLSVNGRFVHFGPARTAGGYARVDEISLDKYHDPDRMNEIVLEVAGYYCFTISTVRQPSFVCAELRLGDEVLMATGRDFQGYCSCRRMRKVERYSMQRHFGEIWDYREEDPFAEKYRVTLVPAENRPEYLPRRVPMPTYEELAAEGFCSGGRFRYEETMPCRENRYSGNHMSPEWGQFYKGDAVSLPYRWIQKQKLTKTEEKGSFPIRISAGEYVMVDLGAVKAGFLSVGMRAVEDTDAVLGFSELCSPDEFAFTNMNCQNVIEYFLPEGAETVCDSFEPYTCRFAILMVRKGTLVLQSFGIRCFEFDRSRMIHREVRDPLLRKIYEAAEHTFAHNAVDIYSDCPSRERAGWLCDSYFTGRAEYFLTGQTAVEDAFLENYRLFKNDGAYPEGVLPMCYPSDPHDEGKFIPQWDMWYVLEVRDYLTVRNPHADKEAFRDSVYGVLRFLEKHENRDGLLQRLPSWGFVEWSSANEWTQDVNYPTNFLYAEVLRAVAELYGEKELALRAERVAAKTAELSFDGEVFIDNALLDENGVPRNTRNSSEAGQYYALLFGNLDVTDPKYARLMEYVGNNFSTFNTEGRGYTPVNAFIGLYLRICYLMKSGEKELLEKDLKYFFGGMADSTHTLWEYREHKGSHDHGFASIAALAIDFVEN